MHKRRLFTRRFVRFAHCTLRKKLVMLALCAEGVPSFIQKIIISNNCFNWLLSHSKKDYQPCQMERVAIVHQLWSNILRMFYLELLR